MSNLDGLDLGLITNAFCLALRDAVWVERFCGDLEPHEKEIILLAADFLKRHPKVVEEYEK